MEKQKEIQGNLEMVKEKASILYSTLHAIHVALTANIYDGSMYAEAIHGAAHLAQELMEELKAVLEANGEGERKYLE